MALGNIGIKRAATVAPEDVEILMLYTPSRDVTNNFLLKKLDSVSVLTPYKHNANTGGNVNVEILGGLYSLKLPATEFNTKGIYNIYIRPVEIRTSITDCGILSTLPGVKGLVFDINNVPAVFRNKFVSSGLVGYRIEYLNDDGTKIPNFFRVITSSFFVEAITQNLTNSNQKSVRYRYTDSLTNLMYCTLTPSTAPTNKPNAIPFIGQPGQNIIITNTFFNPISIEIEIANYDLDTLALGLYGNQAKSVEDGIYTIYDENNNIFKQYDLYEIRDQFGEPDFEIRKDRKDNIDFSKDFNSVSNP